MVLKKKSLKVGLNRGVNLPLCPKCKATRTYKGATYCAICKNRFGLVDPPKDPSIPVEPKKVKVRPPAKNPRKLCIKCQVTKTNKGSDVCFKCAVSTRLVNNKFKKVCRSPYNTRKKQEGIDRMIPFMHLYANREMTLEEIGQQLGLSRERIRQIFTWQEFDWVHARRDEIILERNDTQKTQVQLSYQLQQERNQILQLDIDYMLSLMEVSNLSIHAVTRMTQPHLMGHRFMAVILRDLLGVKKKARRLPEEYLVELNKARLAFLNGEKTLAKLAKELWPNSPVGSSGLKDAFRIHFPQDSVLMNLIKKKS